MSRTLYDLQGADDRRYSPYCWRIRLALAHKGLQFDTVPVRFCDKELLAFSGQIRVPVLTDGDTTVFDSWDIACYLEDTYPDRPSLFGGAIGRGTARFVNDWSDGVLNPALLKMIIMDVFHNLEPVDREYFRASREKRFGARLEDVQAGREERLPAFRHSLAPVRAVIEAQPFLCGDQPAYADFIVFSVFQWGRCMSEFTLLAADDPLCAWRSRMLDLFGGMAREAKGYPC
jgi:glutathione S-transferase